MTELESLKTHIDDKFAHHEEMDMLRQKGIDTMLITHADGLKENKKSVLRVHSRVDEITTQIKTVKGIGLTIAGGVSLFLAWIGLTK